MSSVVNQLFQYEKKKQKTLNNMTNGRVDITGKYEKGMALPLFIESDNGIDGCNLNSIAYMFESTGTQEIFFSKKNIEHLQKLLKYHVWLQSNKKHIIGDQDHNQLSIIMKSIYLQYGQNNNVELNKQIKRLNAFVLEYAIPNILLNIEQHKVYKKHVSTLPKPMDLPTYISTAGTRTNPTPF
tara:strand:+ start:223 stop:771 length:549 start_codon:yes stop_codon:yes gene_type:complete